MFKVQTPILMCEVVGGGGHLTPPSNSATPAGIPIIQLNSVTIYLGRASDFTG